MGQGSFGRRIGWIDAGKGAAIILVVAGHVLDGAMGKNIYSGVPWMGHLYAAIYAFHMPLFFFLSGTAFSLVRAGTGGWDGGKPTQSLQLKLCRLRGGGITNLILVYLFWSAFMYTFKKLLSSIATVVYEDSLLECLLINPVDPYWYLITLAYYHIITGLLLNGKEDRKGSYLLILILSLLASGIAPYAYSMPGIVNQGVCRFLYRIVYHYFFFFGGVFFMKRKKTLGMYSRTVLLSLLSIALLVLAAREKDLFSFPFVKAITAAAIIFSILQVLFWIDAHCRAGRMRILLYLGRNSLYVYLLHNYFTVLFRTIYQKTGGELPSVIYVLANTVLTLAICSAVPLITQKIPVLDIFFRPVKTFRALKNNSYK